MSKREKLLVKIMQNPTNVRFEILQQLLIGYGFVERTPRGGSSHYTYSYKEYIITVPKKKPVNTIYVKRVIEILKELNIIEKV